jgi:serine/threonine protein kinase
LAERMLRQPLNRTQVASLGASLAKTLQVAHTAKIVHRDLKPANILLTLEGHAMVLGFGLPRRKVGTGFLQGTKGIVIGSPAYLAPEQAAGNGPADPRSDIYSLGVIIFQLLTGQLPFRGTLQQVLEQIATKPCPAASQLRSDLPWEWDVFCKRCLAKDPAKRYQTAEEVLADLQILR